MLGSKDYVCYPEPNFITLWITAYATTLLSQMIVVLINAIKLCENVLKGG